MSLRPEAGEPRMLKTADAAAGRDVNAWVETVPRRYGQHEEHAEQESNADSYDDEDY